MKRDRLIIKSLKLKTYIGALEWEQRSRQQVEVDLEIEIDARHSAKTDLLGDCVDYTKAVTQLKRELENKHTHLIETLALWIAERILTHSGVYGVEVALKKFKVLQSAEYGGITIYRQNHEYQSN